MGRFHLTAREIRLVFLSFLFFILCDYLLFRTRHTNTNRLNSNHSSLYENSNRLENTTTSRTDSLPTRPEDTWMEWETPPETSIPEHSVPGITIFQNLYVYDRTFYIVTSSPEFVPPLRYMFSKGLILKSSVENEPDGNIVRIIGPKEAKLLFGGRAVHMPGVTFIQLDGQSFIGSAYHLVVETLALWHWRAYSALSLDHLFNNTIESPMSSGPYKRPIPRRFIFPNAYRFEFEDSSGFNLFTLRAAFPDINLIFREDWSDALFSGTGSPALIFDTVSLGDRVAWHRGQTDKGVNWKSPSATWPIKTSDDWWSDVRSRVVRYSQPANGVLSKQKSSTRPVITYINRQRSGRRIKEAAHREIVRLLEELGRLYDYEIQIIEFDKLPKTELVYLLNRTTVLLSVHGNGMTGQLWMEPTKRTTVIELLYPGGFLHDHEYTARALGIKWYGIWNNRYFSPPELPHEYTPAGFHGSQIPVDAPTVIQLIHRRLSLDDPDDA